MADCRGKSDSKKHHCAAESMSRSTVFPRPVEVITNLYCGDQQRIKHQAHEQGYFLTSSMKRLHPALDQNKDKETGGFQHFPDSIKHSIQKTARVKFHTYDEKCADNIGQYIVQYCPDP
jgi:hypothetical protein